MRVLRLSSSTEERIKGEESKRQHGAKQMKRKHRQSGSDINSQDSVSLQTRRIVFVAAPGVEILDLVGPLQVFARASEIHTRANPRRPPMYSVEVVTISSRRSMIANCGLRITAHRTYRGVSGKIDTLLVAGGNAVEQNEISPEAVRWLMRISPRIRRVGSVCTGAMLLARAGLLDGRRATTHWNWCHTLIKRAPRARVESDPIFIRDENVYTSAGVTAGMDLALALVEEDHGSRLALQVARNLVLYLRRPGGQSQFSAALSLQLTDRKPLRELEAWVLDNLHKPLTVPLLAERVAMSPRNFARVFAKEMKTTPAKFVERLRVEAARRRLEESHNSMETIASECGFGNVNSMRNVFQRRLKIAPGQYRRHFRHMKRPARKSSTKSR
jgi:transcriptional regulator GlxA family with amidase domain